MQSQLYFLKVNDQQLDYALHCTESIIVNFINEHVQEGKDNKLVFYCIIQWLDGNEETVLKEEKKVIFETTTQEKVTFNHEMLIKIGERKQAIIDLYRAQFYSQQWISAAKNQNN